MGDSREDPTNLGWRVRGRNLEITGEAAHADLKWKEVCEVMILVDQYDLLEVVNGILFKILPQLTWRRTENTKNALPPTRTNAGQTGNRAQ